MHIKILQKNSLACTLKQLNTLNAIATFSCPVALTVKHQTVMQEVPVRFLAPARVLLAVFVLLVLCFLLVCPIHIIDRFVST